MSAANTDKFRKTSARKKATTNASMLTNADTSVDCTALTNWPTDTAVDVTFNRVNSDDELQDDWETVVAVVSSNSLTEMVRGKEGTASAWPSGTVIELLNTANIQNDMVDGILVEHGQNGTHDNTKVAMLAGSQTFTGTKTIQNLIWNGWAPAGETWSYTTDKTFTVAGSDVTAKYKAGTRVKYTQTTVKYGIVEKSALSGDNTVITLIETSDYTLADAEISANYYSYGQPPDCPTWFSFTPVFTGFSADPANNVCRYYVVGSAITVNIRMSSNGTSNSTAFSIAAPVTAKTITSGGWYNAMAIYIDDTTIKYGYGVVVIASGGTSIVFQTTSGSDGWTASGGKRCNCQLTYEF